MSNNPFDDLMGAMGGQGGQGGGLGGLDLGALMQQAQQMQADLMEAQQRLAEATVEGQVGGGAVTVTITGAGELTGVRISPDAVSGTDADALEDLGDLIVAAFRDARARAEEMAQEAMGPLAGGLPDLGGLGGELDGPQPGQEPPHKLGF